MRSTQLTIAAAVAAGLVGILLLLPTIRQPHHETDEQVHLWLAENLSRGKGYNLRGTEILPTLNPEYDRPLFHHPPLYIILMIPLMRLGGDAAAVVASWLGHLVWITAIAVAVFPRSRGGRAPPAATWALPLAAAALDPLMLWVSGRILLDGLLAGLTVLAMALFLRGLESDRRRLLWVGAGCAWGAALLTKTMAGLLVIPVGTILAVEVVTAVRRSGVRGAQALAVDAGALVFPAALLALPWFVVFYRTYGMLLPTWGVPGTHEADYVPFIRLVMSRPWWYFLAALPRMSLVVPVVVGLQLWCLRRSGREELRAWIWAGGIVGGMTAICAAGLGFQMRYVAFGTAPFYLLLGLLAGRLESRGRRALTAATGVIVAAHLVYVIWLLQHPEWADPYFIDEMAFGLPREGA